MGRSSRTPVIWNRLFIENLKYIVYTSCLSKQVSVCVCVWCKHAYTCEYACFVINWLLTVLLLTYNTYMWPIEQKQCKLQGLTLQSSITILELKSFCPSSDRSQLNIHVLLCRINHFLYIYSYFIYIHVVFFSAGSQARSLHSGN